MPAGTAARTVKQYLPWVVATALFTEQLDSTIVNTAIPSMAVSLGLPPWESGLLMMPIAAAAMFMKFFSTRILRRHGFRQILMVNTVMLGATIGLFSLVTASTPLSMIVLLSLAQGFFNSLQFSAMNAMAYADIEPADSSMATSIASTCQQLSLSFGLACGSLVAGW